MNVLPGSRYFFSSSSEDRDVTPDTDRVTSAETVVGSFRNIHGKFSNIVLQLHSDCNNILIDLFVSNVF